MNKFIVKSITVNEEYISYDYHISGEWKKYFNLDEMLSIKYSYKINDIPYGIAVIPLLCNILPLAWIFDGTVIVDEIDEDFYLSISKFKKGYEEMYPKISFKGSIISNSIIKYNQKPSNKSLALFSGGVDAFYTLLSNIKENPEINTIWGADIKLDDLDGWNRVLEHTIETANLYNLDYSWIKSNFRLIINEGELTKYVYEKSNDGWWHGFQHGIGLIGHLSPIVFKNNIKKIYIAASFTINEKGKVTCASDPSIDNNLEFCGCKVKHDGYEASRQDKIKFICNYAKEYNLKIPLRVCWQSTGGSNCCRCEKCYRTLFGIIAEKQDPRNFGFNYTDNEFKEIVLDLKNNILIGNFRWEYIQNRFRENYSINQVDNCLKWFYKSDILKIDNRVSLKINNFKKRIKWKFKSLFG